MFDFLNQRAKIIWDIIFLVSAAMVYINQSTGNDMMLWMSMALNAFSLLMVVLYWDW